MQSELPVRRNIRLKDHDYSRAGYYFVTICVKDGHEMLGVIKNNQLSFSEHGHVVKQEIENIGKIRKECIVKKFVLMPNHVHLIVQIVGDDSNRPANARTGNRSVEPQSQRADTVEPRADCHPPLRRSIPNMVQGLKGAITRQIGFSIWQRSYHDHIIRSEEEYQRIWQYIDENPAKWREDRYFGKR
ncbi:MAG: hypothetical protein FWC96_05020 [Oscillospiraceae bacterium]|nr:hypothetical protein [Oscillospiraceae bacterium]